MPEEELQELLLNAFNLTKNDDLFNYVYNLCNIGSDSASKKVADLWDEHYVDVNKDVYNLSINAYDDPSFYIWCGIPYELLDKIYPFLENPIAKIFYLVCLSIRDTFKSQELNEKHSIDKEASEILLLFEEFSQNELEEALIKFFSANWELYHFQFLFSFVMITENLIKCMIENIRSERRSLSNILSIKFKSDTKGEKNILSYFFEICRELTINFCQEVMTFYDQRDKIALFSELIESNNIQALSLAVEFWENYENLIIELSELDFEEIKTRILNTKNFKYIRNLKRSFRPDIRKVNQIGDLKVLKQEILNLEKLIEHKMNDDSILYLDKRTKEFFDRTFEYTLKDIKEREMELKSINLDLEEYFKYLNKSDEEGIKRIINARFPSIHYHRSDKSMIWKKIDELNWIKSQTFKQDKAKELIDKRIEEYQRSKEEILKYPDHFNEDVDYFKFPEKHLFESPFLKEVIIKDVRITFNKLKNIDHFLSELKTIKAKQRILYHLLNSYFPDQGYYTPWEKIKKEKYEDIKERIITIFEDYLSIEDMEEIFEYFHSKIKIDEDDSESREKTISYEDEEILDDFGYSFYDKEFHDKLDKAKERIYSELLNEPINISEIEKHLKNLGDGFEFKQFVSLIIEKDEPEYFYGNDKKMYGKISPKNRKILQKYLFHWILKQRKRYQDNLQHDSFAVADESNQISDVDAGISIDNLFEDVYTNSITNGYFPTSLNHLKETDHKDWYEIIKYYTLFQIEPGIKEISSVQYEYRSRLNIPINQAIIEAFEEKEIKWSLLLYSATHFYNVVNIQLFDLSQFLNGFKLRKTTKHTGYYDD